jgi:hypothetical protein
MFSSPSPNITHTEDPQEEVPPCPSPDLSTITLPLCVIHDECETVSSMTAQLPSPRQSQLTGGNFTPPTLSGPSAPTGPKTAKIEEVERFPPDEESFKTSLFPIRPGRQEVGAVSKPDSTYELPGPHATERARIVYRGPTRPNVFVHGNLRL